MNTQKYICDKCGEIISTDELIWISESRGEFWGMPCYEDVSACPHCKCTELYEYEKDEDDENEIV